MKPLGMARSTLIVAAWLSIASSSALAMSGADLREFCKEPGRADSLSLCFGYISGVIDKALLDNAMKAGPPPKVGDPPTALDKNLVELYEVRLRIQCEGEGVTRQQFVAVVQKYLRDHPERWHLPAAHLVIQAVVTAFPCK